MSALSGHLDKVIHICINQTLNVICDTIVMIKLIRIIAFIVAAVSAWSVYSRPEVREALLMGIAGDTSAYEDEYYDDHEYDDPDDEHGDYNYD